MVKKQKTVRHIPYEILVEILPRLSTRSLLIFSCVAKSWNSLIFSHGLAQKQPYYLNMHSSFKHGIMLLSDNGRKLEHFSLHSALSKPRVPVFDTNHVHKFPISTRMFYELPDGELCECHPLNSLIGSYNGLICIAVGTSPCISGNYVIYLWNPCIQKSKKIPSFGEERVYKFIRSYGFGFDELCDDYKVVAYCFCSTDEYDVLVKIFSLKTGEVKRIKNYTGHWLLNHTNRIFNHTTFANGKIHWFAKRKETADNLGENNCHIAYLDLETEEHGEIKKPASIEFSIGGTDSMTALPGGSLYVYCASSRVNSNGDLIGWVVEPSYGSGKTSWKQVIVSIPVYFPMKFGLRNPLFMLDNNVTVWLCGGNVVIFNPNDLSVRPSQLTNPDYPLTGIFYIESLVSPLMTCDDVAG